MTQARAILLTAVFLAGANAQTETQTAYKGQAWVGLLVSAACEKTADANKARHESDLTLSGRTTTPAVDDAGTRGSSDRDVAPPSQKQMLPETGDVVAKPRSSTDPSWGAAHRQAESLHASCTVDASTSKFALLLPDGRMPQFDELANQAIAKQLPSFPIGAKSRKVLRVAVQGKMQDGKIALDSIQM